MRVAPQKGPEKDRRALPCPASVTSSHSPIWAACSASAGAAGQLPSLPGVGSASGTLDAAGTDVLQGSFYAACAAADAAVAGCLLGTAGSVAHCRAPAGGTAQFLAA